MTLPTGTSWLGPGPEDGDGFGADVVGDELGDDDGDDVGELDGDGFGADVVGDELGDDDGGDVGELDGTPVGFDVVGAYEGVSLPLSDGDRLATSDGAWDAVIDG